jgi:hypothetical protein
VPNRKLHSLLGIVEGKRVGMRTACTLLDEMRGALEGRFSIRCVDRSSRGVGEPAYLVTINAE